MRRMAARHGSTLALAATCLAMAALPAAAQKPGGGGFATGYTDIGPVVGLGNLGAASLAFGGRFEHGIQPLPSLANGMLGVEVGLDYASGSAGCGAIGDCFTARQIGIEATANYHFRLDDPRFDPFLGLGLAYRDYSCSYNNLAPLGFGCGYSSGILIVGRAGARYFFAPNMALYADVGAGVAVLNAGLMFKLH